MLNSSIWRAVLSLFYPPVIIGGKNGKNSENPVGSNKSEKRKPKSAVYRSFWASVVYFHLRLISTKSHKREMTRNRFVLNRARGFESHHLRQQKAPAQAGAFFATKMVRMRTGRRSAGPSLLLYSITHPIVKCVGFVGLHGEPDKSAFGNIFHFSTRRHEKRPGFAGLPRSIL